MEPSNKLLVISHYLNIYSKDKTTICNKINEIYNQTMNKIKAKFIDRQRDRLYFTYSSPAEMLQKKDKKFINESRLNYNDYDLASYSDGENIYLFTSDLYDNILADKDKYPKVFIDEVIFKSNYLRTLNLPRSPISFSDAIDIISKDDVISNKESDDVHDLFMYKISCDDKLREKISNMDGVGFNKILASLKIESDNIDLTLLTPRHALITLIKILVKNKLECSKVKSIFDK